MKFYLGIFSIFISFIVEAQNSNSVNEDNSPLAAYSSEWNKPVYEKCNTAENVIFMSSKEKEVIYVLNLLRTYPQQFVNTVIKKYPEESGNEDLIKDTYYFQSLIKTMLAMKPAPLLMPDKNCYSSAQCHAYQSGITGYTGHDRTNKVCEKKEYFDGECCDYGNEDALDIVLSLLIDQGVPSLGHRSICLGDYQKIGVSIQPHKSYRFNTVLDFHY